MDFKSLTIECELIHNVSVHQQPWYYQSKSCQIRLHCTFIYMDFKSHPTECEAMHNVPAHQLLWCCQRKICQIRLHFTFICMDFKSHTAECEAMNNVSAHQLRTTAGTCHRLSYFGHIICAPQISMFQNIEILTHPISVWNCVCAPIKI